MRPHLRLQRLLGLIIFVLTRLVASIVDLYSPLGHLFPLLAIRRFLIAQEVREALGPCRLRLVISASFCQSPLHLANRLQQRPGRYILLLLPFRALTQAPSSRAARAIELAVVLARVLLLPQALRSSLTRFEHLEVHHLVHLGMLVWLLYCFVLRHLVVRLAAGVIGQDWLFNLKLMVGRFVGAF